MFQTGRIEFTVLDFLILNLFGPGLFRIPCFGFRILVRELLVQPQAEVERLERFELHEEIYACLRSHR